MSLAVPQGDAVPLPPLPGAEPLDLTNSGLKKGCHLVPVEHTCWDGIPFLDPGGIQGPAALGGGAGGKAPCGTPVT
jgi:hypothetical protein